MALFILAVIVFIIADILIRMISKRLTEKKLKKEREIVLQESLRLDFTNEAKTLKGYKLSSLDGEFGTIKEFYFDDHYWTIRYLVVDTGDWLTERKVLISPHALKALDKDKGGKAERIKPGKIINRIHADFNRPPEDYQ